ncbi:MAG: aldo/keto reductase [Thermoleophilia bacterium]|nr:aldo/keto reductase [Thermoleophilia bacterium]
MQQRLVGSTGLSVSEIGFGVWTIATGWWGKYTEDEAITLLRAAFDAGITFFNTGNVYGADGYGEKLVAKALADVRDQVTIATTFGYDVDAERVKVAGMGGHTERPHDWSADNVRRSLESSLENLGTDTIDIWQLHNPRMDALRDDKLWALLDDLRSQGMVKSVGPSIGPKIGWKDEGLFAIAERDIDFIHHIFNMLEQEPGRDITDAAADKDIAVFVRVPHSSGLLEGKFDADTKFDADDHRSHRKQAWLDDGLKKVDALQFLVDDRDGATIGQVALKWLLSDPAITSVQPNVYSLEQIAEFAAAPDIEEFDADELGEIDVLNRDNFGIEVTTAEHVNA